MEKTPLYDCHLKLGGKMVPFAGFMLPVQYPAGLVKEHLAVRQKAGLFDVSHMGEAVLSGEDALSNLQRLLTNDMKDMTDGQVRYSPMCNANGGVVDDLLVYRIHEKAYFLVVNASNKDKDVQWIRDNLEGNVSFSDISNHVAQLAIQGPVAQKVLEKLSLDRALPKKYYTFEKDMYLEGKKCLVSRTGYTGEAGFEIYCDPADAPFLWERILAEGEELGLIPCGLGARDTLRLEAAMPLYGHEMNDEITPLETGLDFFVKMEKDFIGRKAMLGQPPRYKRVGIKMTGKGIARENYPVHAAGETPDNPSGNLPGEKIGQVSSGTHCPYLDTPLAMALIDVGYQAETVFVDVRGRLVEGKIIPLPFYKREKRR